MYIMLFFCIPGGTGTLFFEFYRILVGLRELHPDHHMFWLFENVCFMQAEVKSTISRFLGVRDLSVLQTVLYTVYNHDRCFAI